MKTHESIILSGLALILSACSTTSPAENAAVNNKLSDVYYSGFSAKADGSFVHGGTGLFCPPSLLELPYDDQHEYGDQHKDASCTYKKDETVATIYLSELDYEIGEYFQSSVASVFQGPFGEGLEVDQDASQACTLGGLLMAASSSLGGASGASGSDNRNQNSYGFQPAVLYSPDLLTLIQLTEIDGKFLKLRYTLLEESQAEGLSRCVEASKALRDIYELSFATSRRAAQN